MRFLSNFFYEPGPSLALTIWRKKNRIFSKSRRDIHNFWYLAGVNDTGEAYHSDVIETGKNYYTGINDTAVVVNLSFTLPHRGQQHRCRKTSPVSTTPVKI